MITLGSYEAKTRLPELLRMVEAGESVTITRHGRPVALLTAPSGLAGKTREQVVRELMAFGKGRPLGAELTIRDLIDEGRR